MMGRSRRARRGGGGTQDTLISAKRNKTQFNQYLTFQNAD